MFQYHNLFVFSLCFFILTWAKTRILLDKGKVKIFWVVLDLLMVLKKNCVKATYK